ncbi:hypothetical protein [Nocardia mexicana]|uniref:DUF8175 domain-containing protein n=1 Tax=Nocardia mexicana TaxID=279262 RepID=A0A370GJZ9_9NOCA|nr:hypothetical protein [Nocardia mexicana]RDI43589.1 hypothetical protein DFR68_12056 [Nocardia mexicana]
MKHPTPATATTAVLAVGVIGLSALAGCGSSDDPGAPQVAVDTADVHDAPTNLKSTGFQGILLPVADQGPHQQNGPAATGFDHNPVGAALAAIHATVRMSVATDTQWPVIGQQMLAPGPGRDTWALARAQLSITEPAAVVPKVLGYQVTSYTPDRTDIAIYTLQPDTSLTRNTATVVWQSEDWKLLVPDQPRAPAVSTLLSLPADLITLPMR